MMKKHVVVEEEKIYCCFAHSPAEMGSNEGHSTESLESCFARGHINQLPCNRHVLSGKGIT